MDTVSHVTYLLLAFLVFTLSATGVYASEYGSKEWLKELEATIEKNPVPKAELWIDPIPVIEKQIRKNKLGITKDDIAVASNSKGKGFFIYVPRIRFSGVERNIIWFVNGDKAVKLNGATNLVTPKLPFPQDAYPAIFDGSNLTLENITETGLKQAFKK